MIWRVGGWASRCRDDEREMVGSSLPADESFLFSKKEVSLARTLEGPIILNYPHLAALVKSDAGDDDDAAILALCCADRFSTLAVVLLDVF